MPSAVLDEDGTAPIAKRQKLTDGNGPSFPKQRAGSRIFAPFRTLGLVSPTSVPFTSVALGKTTFQITTSVGRSLQTYDLRRGLNLVFLSRPQTPAIITATYAWKDRVFAAWGGQATGSNVGVWVFKRGKMIAELELPKALCEPIRQVTVFGTWIIGCCLTRVEVWKSATHEHYTTITPPRLSKSTAVQSLSGAISHLPTFLNKIFLGKQDGGVDIWNLSTGKLIYTILPPSSDCGPVTALEATPVLGLLAIARSDGSIIIQDACADLEILRLNAKSSRRVPVTSISFRTDWLGAGDDGRAAGVMATANKADGDVTVWDLNQGGRIMGVLRGAHNPPSSASGAVVGGISRIEFLTGQPVLISSGLDNALRSWIFDETPFSPVPRILHSRSGHAASVTRLEFLPTDADGADAGGKWLLSAGRDQSLWGWSLRRDGQSTELSQGNVRRKAKKLGLVGNNLATRSSTTLEDLKAPEITCLACSLNRDGGMGASTGGGRVWTNMANKKGGADASESGATGWESVVTGHRGDKCARTWFWGRRKAGRWAFETGDGTEVKSVTITSCGTFALVGSAGGCIDMFNLQSGIHRQRFPSKLTPGQARKLKMMQANGDRAITERGGSLPKYGLGEGKHTKAVTGLIVDGLNRTVISCGLDGKIKFWDFLTGCLQDQIDWYPMAAISASRYYRQSDLIALSCDDLSIRVVDIETKRLVRELRGCLGHISDFCFSNDGRWIVAASLDSIIRVWDLPTGNLIDAVRLDSTCTALAFSNTGEFLATSHADGVGINIWNNRTLFTHVPTRQIGEDEIVRAIGPTASGEGGQNLIDAAFEQDGIGDGMLDTAAASLDQLSRDIVTLSLVPKSRWQTLLHLDDIRQRNKPKEPPKAPEKAPFFLPSLENAQKTLKPRNEESQITAAERSRISKMNRDEMERRFTTFLRACADDGEYGPIVEHLKSLSPSAADIEIRSLNPQGSSNELVSFVAALTYRLKQKADYELVQAWMSVFLRIHGERVAQDSDLVEALREWRVEQGKEAKRLGALVGYCGGVVAFLRSGRT
ncbi:MAG: WD domain-containing [Lasallia pustulata]|uniref:WD domain-containing n=1 Tax=Lasallia pustulata TaxID=136370 RepID=A0A5M8PW06_9LECA|nr:MAG: WD domain-containing [Lasallia pustulata]